MSYLQAELELITSQVTSNQAMTKRRVRVAPGDFDSDCQTEAFWEKAGSSLGKACQSVGWP